VERATAKIASDYAGDASQIKDLLRATIEVNSVADARLAIDQIKKEFEVLKSGQRDLLDPAVPSVDGYRGGPRDRMRCNLGRGTGGP
jgi:hypothetical protein